MQRRTQFRSPLLGWSRQPEAGPEARFGHRILHPVALIAVIAFVLIDAFLVIRLTRDDPTFPARPAGSLEGSGSVETTDTPVDQLGDLGQTKIGTPIVSGKVVARLDGNDRSDRKPRQDASGAGTGTETVVSSSTSSTGTTSGGSTSDGGSTSGSSTGGSGTGGSDSGGTVTGGGGSGGGGSGGGGDSGDGGAAGGGGGGG